MEGEKRAVQNDETREFILKTTYTQRCVIFTLIARDCLFRMVHMFDYVIPWAEIKETTLPILQHSVSIVCVYYVARDSDRWSIQSNNEETHQKLSNRGDKCAGVDYKVSNYRFCSHTNTKIPNKTYKARIYTMKKLAMLMLMKIEIRLVILNI